MYLRMIARKKIGIEIPSNDASRLVWSIQLPCRLAAMNPSGTPSTNEKIIAAKASSSVAGKRCWNSSTTGLRLVDRDAEVAAEGRPEIAQVLLRQRVVEPVLLVDRLDLLLGGALPEQRRRRAARQRPDPEEDEDREPEENRDEQQEPADDETQHFVRRLLAFSYPPRVTGANDSFVVGLAM